MRSRNQSLGGNDGPVSKAGIGRSVAARSGERPTDQASRRVGVEVAFTGCTSARIATEVSISGQMHSWQRIGEQVFTPDDRNAVYSTESPFCYVRSVLCEDVEPLVPVLVPDLTPVEHVEVTADDYGTKIITTIETPAPPPAPRWGISSFLAGY